MTFQLRLYLTIRHIIVTIKGNRGDFLSFNTLNIKELWNIIQFLQLFQDIRACRGHGIV